MKNIHQLIAMCFLFGLFCIGQPRAEFVDGIEDIPVMDGLRQQHNENVSFGNEQARFVEAYFSSRTLTFRQVARFYRDTLPQLGWKSIEENSGRLIFERDMESLKIVQEKASPLLLRITLTSKD